MRNEKNSPQQALAQLLLPGTDADVAASYATLASRAQTATFGLFEDDVVVLDTETTGLSYDRDELIEIAAARMNGPKVLETFQTYVDPGRRIPREITELTGIADAQVKGAPGPREAVDRFAQFAGSSMIVAHNASFDHAFVIRHAPDTLAGEWVDTLELARIALPRLSSHGLDALAQAFGTHLPSHDAADDVAALCEVWRILLVALTDLEPGLLELLSHLREDTHWPLRPVFAHLAAGQEVGQNLGRGAADSDSDGGDVPASEAAPAPKPRHFDLKRNRTRRVRADRAGTKEDAEGKSCRFPSPEEVAAGFAPDGAVGRMYASYEPRPEQVTMAREVAQAFADSTHRAIEAGTGVGKSIAYLYPAVLAARRNNITIGISTRTNALMDQLVFHELPLLAEAVDGGGATASAPDALEAPSATPSRPQPLRYCALKGYDHYPCLRKLERFASQDPTGVAIDDARALTMIATLYTFASQSSWGDLDSVPLFWRDMPRDQIACASNDCLKKRCPFYPNQCYLHGVRNRAKSADIVVTNHALLFRNLVMDNAILPPIRHWIVDEAHSAESEARRQLSPGLSQADIEHVCERLDGRRGVLMAIERKAGGFAGGALLRNLTHKVRPAIQTLRVVNDSFWDFVKDLSQLGEDSSYDRLDLWISKQVRESGAWGAVRSCGEALHKRLEDLTREVRDLANACEPFETDIPAELADLTQVASQLYDLKAALGVIIDGSDEHYVYEASIDRRPNVHSESLSAQVIDVGDALVEGFYPEVHSVIYTSATIATGARPSASPRDPAPFAHFAHAVGLDRIEKGRWSALRLESGYDFARNMAVYVPNDMPEPSNRQLYLPSLERLIEQVHLATGGSVLTLFTNRREMERVYDDLAERLHARGIDLICQRRGASAKRLRDQFLADERLSLFALRSFWEGFDAPGDTLRCVVVTKLPFSRPTDPLAQERRLRDDRAWSHFALPEAIIDFKQACGRLIRSSTDTGCLVLPDARLVTKRYGKAFLAALPPAPRHVAPTDQLIREIRARFGR